MPDIVVVGSLNMDLVLRAPHIPGPGETVLGSDFQMLPGGKGANQANAAAQLGAKVAMVGKVGYDLFGDRLRANLAAAGVDVSQVRSTQEAATGVAAISVDRQGQNSIVVASGANFAWQVGEAESLRKLIGSSAWLLCQLETPLAFVKKVLEIAQGEGASTMLDPAPAQALDREIFDATTLLTPNESEALLLLGEKPGPLAAAEASAVAARLHAMGAKAVLLKLGEQGCYYSGAGKSHFQAAPRVEAVDSTAAGDTFNAALAVALAEGQSMEGAMHFANHAAALSVTRVGAQSSAPKRAEVNQFTARNR